jgi:ribosomal protein L32E
MERKKFQFERIIRNNAKKIWNIWRKPKLNSEKIGKIWKKSKLNNEKK